MKFRMKTTILMFAQLLLLLTFISCSSNKIESTLNIRKTDNNLGQIQQNKRDLLAGVSRAICYSGYREGQHPDRGDGAVNPSYEETLEDLQILSRNSNFKLIRLYDSGENSLWQGYSNGSLIASMTTNAANSSWNFSGFTGLDKVVLTISGYWNDPSFDNLAYQASVPTPAPLALMGLGLAALSFTRRKKSS